MKPVITTDGENDEIVALLNGNSYALGTEISSHGTYTLAVTATNEDGKSITVTLNFEIGVPKVHQISINEGLVGFTTTQNSTIEYDDTLIRKDGNSDVSIKFALGNKTYGGMVVRGPESNQHPHYPTDWSQYDRITAWVYLDEIDDIPTNKGLTLKVWGSPAVSKQIPKSQLSVGWNFLEYDIAELMNVRIDELKNMSNHFEFVVDRSSTSVPKIIYITEIQFVKD